MTVFVSSISGKYLSESLYECYGLNYIKYQRVQHVLLWGKKSRDRHTDTQRKREGDRKESQFVTGDSSVYIT